MFLLNSRRSRFVPIYTKLYDIKYSFSLSYRIILQSSLNILHLPAFGYAPKEPVLDLVRFLARFLVKKNHNSFKRSILDPIFF